MKTEWAIKSMLSQRMRADSQESSKVKSEPIKFRISWKYRDGSKKGHGEPIFNMKEATETAKIMNGKVPYVLHWAEPCVIFPLTS